MTSARYLRDALRDGLMDTDEEQSNSKGFFILLYEENFCGPAASPEVHSSELLMQCQCHG